MNERTKSTKSTMFNLLESLTQLPKLTVSHVDSLWSSGKEVNKLAAANLDSLRSSVQEVNKLTVANMDSLWSSAQEAQQLAVTDAQKLVEQQLATLQRYSDLGISQWKAAVRVNDLQGLQDYMVKQPELLRTVGEKLMADAREVAQIGVEFVANAQRIGQEKVAAVAPKAA